MAYFFSLKFLYYKKTLLYTVCDSVQCIGLTNVCGVEYTVLWPTTAEFLSARRIKHEIKNTCYIGILVKGKKYQYSSSSYFSKKNHLVRLAHM